MNGLIRFVIAIIVIGILVLVAIQFKNYQDRFDDHRVVESTNIDPCSYPLDSIPIFNGIRIGMKKSDYHFIKESIDFSSETSKGVINWEPIWDADSLVALRLKFDSNWNLHDPSADLVMNNLLAIEAFSAIFDKRLGSGAYEYITSETERKLVGKRVCITVFNDQPVIYASDRCYELIDYQTRHYKDSIEVAKSKALF